jgi:hypothetical protein
MGKQRFRFKKGAIVQSSKNMGKNGVVRVLSRGNHAIVPKKKKEESKYVST